MPYYRNWPKILEIGEKDELVMLVLCRVSLDEDDDLFARLLTAFPECFSNQEVCGPFPYSVIRQLADDDKKQAEQEGVLWDGIEYVLEELGVPYIDFEVTFLGCSQQIPSHHLFPLDWEKAKELKPGEAFEWRGARFVVLENNCREPNPEFFHDIVAIAEELILLDQ